MKRYFLNKYISYLILSWPNLICCKILLAFYK